MSDLTDALIINLAQLYNVPIAYTNGNGDQVENSAIKDALSWAVIKLNDKTLDELKLFNTYLKEGFRKTAGTPFPYRWDLNQAYELTFPDTMRHTNPQEKYIPIEQLKPQIEDKGLEDIEAKEFDLLTYLTEEQDLKGDPRRYDILFKRYGVKGFAAQGKFKGEYCFDKIISSKQADSVNWVNVYFEEKERTNEK